VVGQVVEHGQEQHDEVLQLVHCAQVVAGHMLVAETADTFIIVNSDRATNNANAETATFLIFFSYTLDVFPLGSSAFDRLRV
jgi:hypothetical protein